MYEQLLDELLIFSDKSKRLHWMFLISTAFIAGIYWKLYAKKDYSLARIARPFFSPSGVLDFQLFLTNRVLRALLFLPLEGLILFEASRAMIAFLNPELGGASASTPVFVVFTLVSFIADDAARFLQHLLMHKIPWLWEFHKVHHSATSLTPLTLYRVHPVELLLASLRRIVTSLFLVFFASQVGELFISPWQILGVTGLSFIFNLCGSNLRHSSLPIRFGCFELFLISPYMHQLHHSSDPTHHGKNFGVSLSIWDRLAGTLDRSKTRALEFGLDHKSKERNQTMSFASACFKPFLALGLKTPSASAMTSLLCLLTVLGCDNSQVEPNPPKVKNFSLNHLAKDFKSQVYGKNQRSLILNSQNLSAHAALCRTEPSRQNFEALKSHLKLAFRDFHRLEPLLWDADFESSERNSLRTAISDWPNDKPCSLDREVLALKENPANYRVSSDPQAKGLDGVESLLYRPLEHDFCEGSQFDQWNLLAESERISDRCALIEKLALQVALDIETDAKVIREIPSSKFDTVMLQKVYDSLVIYTDKLLKDEKLGIPTGFNQDQCSHGPGTDQCAFFGHYRSGLGLESIAWNYEGIRDILLGSTAKPTDNSKLGFYGLLLMKNQKPLADRLLETVDSARAHALKHKDQSLVALALAQTPVACEASNQDRDLAPLCTAWKLSKTLSDLVKYDLKAALLLQNVKPVEGDGD